MKGKYWKQTSKVIIFGMVGILLAKRLYQVFSWKDTAGDYRSTMSTFYQLDRNTVDVLFLGSSHAYCTVNIAKLWEDCGIAGYSLAISGQDLASSYHCLVEALKTQKPKVVCLEMYYSVLHGYQDQGNLYRNLLPYRVSRNYVNAVKDIAREELRQDLIAKWPIVHTRYRELQKGDFLNDYPVYMGYNENFLVGELEDVSFYDGDETVAIGAEEEEWLVRIQELAKENQIELCYYLSPYITDEYQAMKHNYVKNLAGDAGIPYLDFIARREEIGLDPAEDFLDWGHTNHSGAEKVTAFLEDYLKTEYELEDHRGDEAFQLWDKNLEARRHEVNNWELQNTTDIAEYMSRLTGLKDYTIIFATCGGYYPENVDLSSIMEQLPWLEDVYYDGGACIWKNGRMIGSITGESGKVTCASGKTDFTVQRADWNDVIYVDGKVSSKASDGINVVVYDNVLGVIADAVGFTSADQYRGAR